MPGPAVNSDGERAHVRHPLSGKPRAAFAVVTGVLVLVGWAVLIASSFLASSESSQRLLSDVLLGLIVVCALATLAASVRAGVGASVAAVAYAIAWWYIGWSLTYSIADIAYYALVAAFFLAPPVVATIALVAGRARMTRQD